MACMGYKPIKPRFNKYGYDSDVSFATLNTFNKMARQRSGMVRSTIPHRANAKQKPMEGAAHESIPYTVRISNI